MAQVRAIAAGILGPDGPVEFVDIPLQELFASLANGTIDIMLFGATHTMERSIFLVRKSDEGNSGATWSVVQASLPASLLPFRVR